MFFIQEAQSHIIRDENSGTENNNEQQGMKDLNKLELTTFVDAYLSMDNIQTSTDVQTNKLTAQVRVIMPPLRRIRGVYCFQLFPSVLPSVTNIVCRTFLSNHASQPLQTWYVAFARVLHVVY